MKYLIYARISPRGSDYDHSAENSTEMQIEYCTTYINNLAGENTVVGIVKDEFASGGDLKRPEMKKIIDDVQHDRAAWDCICVYNLSRLTRSASDLNLIMELLSSHHKTFVSAREPEFDFNNPLGEMVMGVITYVNQYMRKISASTTKDKMMQLARRGEWPCGNPPFGYKRGPAKDNRLYLDPVKSVIVRDVFEMYASELYTTRDIIVKYKLSLSKSQIMKILRNQTYLGKISYDGYLFDGKHDRIVDDNLFQRVQDKLPRIKEAIRPKAYKYPFLLSGLLFCHCGKHLTPGTAKSGAIMNFLVPRYFTFRVA